MYCFQCGWLHPMRSGCKYKVTRISNMNYKHQVCIERSLMYVCACVCMCLHACVCACVCVCAWMYKIHILRLTFHTYPCCVHEGCASLPAVSNASLEFVLPAPCCSKSPSSSLRVLYISNINISLYAYWTIDPIVFHPSLWLDAARTL